MDQNNLYTTEGRQMQQIMCYFSIKKSKPSPMRIDQTENIMDEKFGTNRGIEYTKNVSDFFFFFKKKLSKGPMTMKNWRYEMISAYVIVLFF